jgi:hypothetical protein
MGSIRTCLIQECRLYGVNKDLSGTRMHVILGVNYEFFIQEMTLYGVNKEICVTRMHVILGQTRLY